MGVASASAPRRCFRRAAAGPAISGRGFARYLAISLAAHGGGLRSSVLRPPSSVLRPPASALRPPPSALRPPPSALTDVARGWQAVGRGTSICDRRGARHPHVCNCRTWPTVGRQGLGNIGYASGAALGMRGVCPCWKSSVLGRWALWERRICVRRGVRQALAGHGRWSQAGGVWKRRICVRCSAWQARRLSLLDVVRGWASEAL